MALDVKTERRRLLGLDEQQDAALGDDEEVLELNVGGTHFATFLSTLTKVRGSFLEALVSGRHRVVRDTEKRIFLDRPGHEFGVLLDWLRRGYIEFPDDARGMRSLVREIEFYGLEEPFMTVLGAPEVEVVGDVHGAFSAEEVRQLASWVARSGEQEASLMSLQGMVFDNAKHSGRKKVIMRKQAVSESCKPSHQLKYAGAQLIIYETNRGSVFGGFNPGGMWTHPNHCSRIYEQPNAFVFVLRASHHDLAPLAIRVDPQHAAMACVAEGRFGGFSINEGCVWTWDPVNTTIHQARTSTVYAHPTAYTDTSGRLFFEAHTLPYRRVVRTTVFTVQVV